MSTGKNMLRLSAAFYNNNVDNDDDNIFTYENTTWEDISHEV